MTDKKIYRPATEAEWRLATAKSNSKGKWPFPRMKVGDAITVNGRENFDNATCSYKYAARRYGMKFTRKTVDGSLIIKRIS